MRASQVCHATQYLCFSGSSRTERVEFSFSEVWVWSSSQASLIPPTQDTIDTHVLMFKLLKLTNIRNIYSLVQNVTFSLLILPPPVSEPVTRRWCFDVCWDETSRRTGGEIINHTSNNNHFRFLIKLNSNALPLIWCLIIWLQNSTWNSRSQKRS